MNITAALRELADRLEAADADVRSSGLNVHLTDPADADRVAPALGTAVAGKSNGTRWYDVYVDGVEVTVFRPRLEAGCGCEHCEAVAR